jgi:hypothetical protein
VLGSDKREASRRSPARGATPRAPTRSCSCAVGGGHSARLSIPRDTVLDIRAAGATRSTRRSRSAGAGLMARTIEANLGPRGRPRRRGELRDFPDLIDAMGGIDYTGGCVVSRSTAAFATAATRCA